MERFALALDTSLSHAQRMYLQQVLQEVARVYVDELDDPAFRRWVAQGAE